MTCDELLERLVDPASAGKGGHAALVEHMNGCDRCRSAAKGFGAVERLFGREGPAEPPDDFDDRVLKRIGRGVTPAPWRRLSVPALVAGAVAASVVGWLLFRSPARPDAASPLAAPRPAASRPTGRGNGAAPPSILAVNSEPVSVNVPPLGEAERKRAETLFDLDFLRSIEALASLDPFFSENVVLTGLAGPAAPRPTAAPDRPAESVEQLEARLEEWRRIPPAERTRLEGIDRDFRGRPEDQRDLLVRRWAIVGALPASELAALKRLAIRIGELDAKKQEKLKSDVRAVAARPAAERTALWRALPFAGGLTGQESAAAETLLQR